ncbi:MAG TPA: NADH-quinone oxidoreductase subunit L [Candidatus Polarisedimenticolaceae bacterium]|nr:NADH-quinone oxidoreductase subunit L [Candidatus Polarisedimenticolaceae bacterium]
MFTWACILVGGPLAAFAVLAAAAPLRRTGVPAALLSIAGIGISFAASVGLALAWSARPQPAVAEIVWAATLRVPSIRFGFLVDGLAVSMAVVVSLVALLVQVYSLGYLNEEPRASLGRYYTWQSLFAFSMLGLVLSSSVLQTYVFWELVGLCSFLLIGFWYRRPQAARAALKAFWTTRLGDVGFAIGIVVLWASAGTFAWDGLFAEASSGHLAGMALTVGVAGLFLGAMGKSAQFPLHIWLPDAMEGPTPVSALIHAATMVAAGVFLMVRSAPLLERVPDVAAAVLAIGCLTSLVGAAMALTERDVKRILAFSTVSQLGMMMAAVGAGAPLAAFFHLVTHAAFKALLFLAAGSLIHALGTNDIFAMGRLWGSMRVTGTYFLLGGLALAGVFPFAGFFSKDAVLAEVLHRGHPLAFAVLLGTAAMTAFYMTRAFVVVFLGAKKAEGHPHESPPLLLLPMGVLALLAVGAGAVLEAPVARALSGSLGLASFAEGGGHGLLVPALATAAALGGILVGWLGYGSRAFDPGRVAAAAGPLTRAIERRFYVDDLATAAFRGWLALAAAVGWLDRYLVDGAVNGATVAGERIAQRMRVLQNGKIQDALYAVGLGFLLLVLLALRGLRG